MLLANHAFKSCFLTATLDDDDFDAEFNDDDDDDDDDEEGD